MNTKAKNIVWHNHKVGRERRSEIKRHKPCVIWLTGLPSSGKSAIASELDHILNGMGVHTYVLDGDNIRHGLNKDLGFSKDDRRENMRRVGEVSQLFVDAGLIAIAAFISPFIKDRLMVRSIMRKGEFFEVYVKCPIAVCKERDPKGMYKKALAGEIADFTGVSQDYEEPIDPEIVIETDGLSVQDSAKKIIERLIADGIISPDKRTAL